MSVSSVVHFWIAFSVTYFGIKLIKRIRFKKYFEDREGVNIWGVIDILGRRFRFKLRRKPKYREGDKITRDCGQMGYVTFVYGPTVKI